MLSDKPIFEYLFLTSLIIKCRIKKLKTFTDIMAALGVKPDSLGCETCKPTIGSILSSLYNEHVMAPAHHSYVIILVFLGLFLAKESVQKPRHE